MGSLSSSLTNQKFCVPVNTSGWPWCNKNRGPWAWGYQFFPPSVGHKAQWPKKEQGAQKWSDKEPGPPQNLKQRGNMTRIVMGTPLQGLAEWIRREAEGRTARADTAADSREVDRAWRMSGNRRERCQVWLGICRGEAAGRTGTWWLPEFGGWSPRNQT